MDRLIRLEMVKLLDSCIRIGRTPHSGPIFYLARFDHSRDMFTTRNVFTGVESRMSVADLASAIRDGIAHPSRVRGQIYHG